MSCPSGVRWAGVVSVQGNTGSGNNWLCTAVVPPPPHTKREWGGRGKGNVGRQPRAVFSHTLHIAKIIPLSYLAIIKRGEKQCWGLPSSS